MHLDRDFPADIAAGAGATIEARSEVVELASGREERNRRWSGCRRRWDVGLGIRSADDLAAVAALFHEAGGRAGSFRFLDWGDHKSSLPGVAILPTDQTLGQGDGVATAFQVVKRYGVGASAVVRPILLPRQAGFRVAVAGAELLSGWTLSVTGGILTFSAPPAPGAAVTAGFIFDVPVRFDADTLGLDYRYFTDSAGFGAAPDIGLREVLDLA